MLITTTFTQTFLATILILRGGQFKLEKTVLQFFSILLFQNILDGELSRMTVNGMTLMKIDFLLFVAFLLSINFYLNLYKKRKSNCNENEHFIVS